MPEKQNRFTKINQRVDSFFKNLEYVFDTKDKHKDEKSAIALSNKLSKFDKSKYLKTYSMYREVTKSLNRELISLSIEKQERYREYDYMEEMAEIAAALDIYAHDTMTKNNEGERLVIESKNDDIRKELEYLFYDVLEIDTNLFSWIRNTYKKGDYYLFLDLIPNEGIVDVFPIPPEMVERQEGYDEENPNKVKFGLIMGGSGLTGNVLRNQQTFANQIGKLTGSDNFIEEYQMVHWRNLSDQKYIPYGTSILEQARRAWLQVKLMEDAVLIYRITRAPERLLFFIDVGNIQPKDIKGCIDEIKTRIDKNPIVDEHGRINFQTNVASILDNYWIPTRGDKSSRIEQLPGGCLSLDTKIPLLDGRNLILNDIIKELNLNKKKLWTYSCNPKTGKIEPGLITWAGITHKDTQLIEITLDNGKIIKCTPDHKFIKFGSGKTEAKDLCVGDSLMPFYRKRSSLHKNKNENTYEQYFDNNDKEWKYTHREIGNYFSGSLIGGIIYNNDDYKDSNQSTIHHINFNRYNNDPSNLTFIGSRDHYKYHSSNFGKKFGVLGNEKQKWLRENDKEWHDKINKKRSETIKEYYKNRSKEEAEQHSINKSKSLKKYYKLNNHKVVNIRYLDQKEDVGTLTIDGNHLYHDYHTFALDVGVFTFNSYESIDDLTYYRQKLFAALKIPPSYLSHEADISGRATLAQEDINFARVIESHQLWVESALDQMAITHLILKGFPKKEAVNYELHLNNPSTLNEQQKLELLEKKFALAESVISTGLVSRIFAYKNIIGFTKEEALRTLEQLNHQRKYDEEEGHPEPTELNKDIETTYSKKGKNGEKKEKKDVYDKDSLRWIGTNDTKSKNRIIDSCIKLYEKYTKDDPNIIIEKKLEKERKLYQKIRRTINEKKINSAIKKVLKEKNNNLINVSVDPKERTIRLEDETQ